MTTKQSKPGAPDSLVKASPEGAVELTEQELSQVTGGDGKTKCWSAQPDPRDGVAAIERAGSDHRVLRRHPIDERGLC